MRRHRRILGTLAALTLVLAACNDDPDGDPVIEVEDPDDGEDVVPDDDVPEPEDERDEPPVAPADDEVDEGAEDPNGDGHNDEGPQPDPERVAAPCAVHDEPEDDEMRSFIDLVAPVDGQHVSGETELIGCANVFEATVEWQLVDADGEVLDAGFTTADCSITCNGVFDDIVPLDTAEPGTSVTLEVFSANMADEGPDRLEEVVVTIEVQ